MHAWLKDDFARGKRPVTAAWYNAMARFRNRFRSLSDSLLVKHRPDGGCDLDLDVRGIVATGRADPFLIVLPDDTHYTVTAGRVWIRGVAAAAVAAVGSTAISATRWLYVPCTLSTSGTLTAGAIAESATEPTYWTRDGSNQTVINVVIGKITVASSVASIDYNTVGDIRLFDQAGQTVALDAANNPGYLAAAFADTGTKGASDVLVYRDALQGSVPAQTLRLYVTADSVRAVFSAGTYIDISAGGEISVDLTEVSGYDADEAQVLYHAASGAPTWLTLTDDFECPA